MSEQSEDFQEVDETEVPEQEQGEESTEPQAESKEEAPEEPHQSRTQNAKQRLRRKLREEQNAREAAELRAKELEEKFSTLEKKVETVINPPPSRPSRVNFETEEDYEDALFEWRDTKNQSSPVREPEPQPETRHVTDTVAPEIRKNWESQVDKVEDKYDDFEDVLVSIPKESMTDPMTFAIMESDQGGEIAYFLGKNHKEADRIAKLSQTAQVREIDKLANKFKTTTSKAPDPITPVDGDDSGRILDPSKMTTEQYRDYRRKSGMPY